MEGRRAGHHTLHSRYFGRHYGHVRRRQQGILAARHVATHRINRDILVAEYNARQGLALDIQKGCTLDFGESAYLCLCELNVLKVARGELIEAVANLRSG